MKEKKRDPPIRLRLSNSITATALQNDDQFTLKAERGRLIACALSASKEEIRTENATLEGCISDKDGTAEQVNKSHAFNLKHQCCLPSPNFMQKNCFV